MKKSKFSRRCNRIVLNLSKLQDKVEAGRLSDKQREKLLILIDGWEAVCSGLKKELHGQSADPVDPVGTSCGCVLPSSFTVEGPCCDGNPE